MPGRPPPQGARTRRAAGAVALAAVLILAGCGADARLQRQESAARARTCETLIERRAHVRAPRISPTHWLRVVRKPPTQSGLGNQNELMGECDRIQAQVRGKR